MNSEQLKELYIMTNFYKSDEDFEWDIKITEDEEGLKRFYVPQCSHFGDSLICLDDTYENSGEDCFFIQELLKLYRRGKIIVKD